jgi:two-component system CheB/CheR fusion protein
MLLREGLEQVQKSCPVQIFATDLDPQAIVKARTGLYPGGIDVDVSPERLERFFVKEDGNYRIKKEIRELVVFAEQNMLADPPFTKLEILSCRNLLIYLNPDVQRRLVPMFHYALKPGGFLVLGSSESIGSYADSFQTVDRKQRIYSKKASSGPLALDLGGGGGRRASRGEENSTGVPYIVYSPELGWCTPERILMNVDLPAPLSPSRQLISPARTSSETPSSATTAPKYLEMLRASSSGGVPAPGGGMLGDDP